EAGQDRAHLPVPLEGHRVARPSAGERDDGDAVFDRDLEGAEGAGGVHARSLPAAARARPPPPRCARERYPPPRPAPRPPARPPALKPPARGADEGEVQARPPVPAPAPPSRGPRRSPRAWLPILALAALSGCAKPPVGHDVDPQAPLGTYRSFGILAAEHSGP